MWKAIRRKEFSIARSVIWKHKTPKVKTKNFPPKPKQCSLLGPLYLVQDKDSTRG